MFAPIIHGIANIIRPTTDPGSGAQSTGALEKLKKRHTALRNRAEDPTHALFGMDLEGRPFTMPLSSGPHWVIAGTTGSGKSVFANNLLISTMSHATPDELQITWVDPKKVEATPYIGNPFCPIDPVTDMGDAYGLMQYYCWEMDRRYDDLGSIEVKNIASFNSWVDRNPDEARDKGLQKMPYKLCVIDEYADMVMQESTVEEPIIRLGQKARAAGIHLVIMTQRPSANVISPTLKANIPSRVCLKVFDSTNSSIILDEPGGENLLGFGDGLIKDKTGTITRVQGPFVEDEEIADIFADLRSRYPKPEFIDYKQIVVDNDLCQWAEDYADDVPWKDRHVVKPKRRKQRP